MNATILLLTDEMEPGGVARHVTDLANGLAEKGMTPIVAANDGPFRSRLRERIEFVSLPLYLPMHRRKRFFGLLASFKILAPIIRGYKVSVIHSHKRYTDILGRVLARTMSLPHVSTCHSAFSSLRHVSIFGDTTIACSKVVQEMLIRDFRKDAKTVKQIYSGIMPFKQLDTDGKQRAHEQLNIPRGRRIIASVGQLQESKDRATLVRAIGILKRKRAVDNAVCAILGDGEQRAMLQELVRTEDVQNHVLFLPGASSVEALFNIAEFMVVSSRQEGLPYVLMEAASLGRPTIATDVGGVSEFVIQRETGLLVPPGDPQKLADAIEDLLDNSETVETLGERAREKFLRQFTYDRFINQTMEVYTANRTRGSYAV